MLLDYEDNPYKPDNEEAGNDVLIARLEYNAFNSGAKAQLKKVVESDVWERCDSDGDNFTGTGYFISDKDWQSLLEEVKDGENI